MKDEYYKGMINHVEGIAKENKKAVYNAVRELHNPLPHDIKKYLDENIKRYKKDSRNSVYEITVERPTTMSLRTIQTWLSVLTKEEYLHRQYGRYSLSDKGSRAVEYLMDEFANHALGHLCNFKPNEDLGESVALFTEVFGAYIVYSFIRAMYPTEGRHISLEKEAKIISASIRGAISPMRLFHCFATTSLPAKTSEGYTKPPWKLDKVTYENFMNEFKSRYPHYYEELEEAWQETVDRGKAAGGLA